MNTPLLTQQTLEDTQLMHELATRSGGALEKLYRKYSSLLKSIIMQVIHDEGEAEDVLQDVFIQVWEKPESYSAEKGKLASWLATLAKRRAIDRVRQYCAYRRATERYEIVCRHLGKEFDESHTVEREAQCDDLRELLTHHLAALPLSQQQAVRLAFLESKTQREISSLTGIPLGTVKTRIELGIKKLSSSMASVKAKIY
ncbi:MAG: sigma-70 family RNA polymerase sigma factor [Chthoniobacterales bacterium]